MTIGYFLVQRGQIASAFAEAPVYLGIDRSPWKYVDEKYYSGMLPKELAELRKSSFAYQVGSLSFGLFKSREAVERLAKACDESEADDSQILAVESLGPISAAINHAESPGLGLDAYADGFGSIIALGILQRPEAFIQFLEHLNENGLFETLVELRRYISEYSRKAAVENLEIIESPSQIWVYRISQIGELVR